MQSVAASRRNESNNESSSVGLAGNDIRALEAKLAAKAEACLALKSHVSFLSSQASDVRFFLVLFCCKTLFFSFIFFIALI